jgi:uncharacterized protein YjbI with pentapeptide repeats
MQFEIRSRWTGNVQFTADIECDEGTPLGIKVGLAVKWAFKSDAVLRGAVLSDAVLSGADLSGAVLSDADLSGAVLRGADLSGAVLRGADLRGAVLRGAVLSGAVLSGADLSGADLSDAVLSGAVLRGAKAIFAGVDDRGYDFYLTAGKAPNDIVIRGGCRRWATFAKARAHFTQGYASTGNVPEILAKIDLLETVAKARGYLTVEPVKAA